MKYFILSILVAASPLTQAALIELTPGQPVKASELTANFNYFNSILSSKEQNNLNFTPFTSGQIIKKEGIELEFNKLRALGVVVPIISSSRIKSSELNARFSDIESQLNEFNNPPLIGNIHFLVTQNQNFSGNFNYQDLDGSSVTTTLTTQATKGTVSILDNGVFTFTPTPNELGSDSFTISYSDGEATRSQTISLSIDGNGIISNANVHYYYDGTFATSCNAYKTTNSGKYTYSGVTGSGTYRIKPDSNPAFDVTCDMITNGGGWTLISNANQVSNTYQTTPPQLTTTQNFNIRNRFSNWEDTSKLVKLNNSLVIGEFNKTSQYNWAAGSITLRGGGTTNLRYSGRADSEWYIPAIPYAQIGPALGGGFCNTFNNIVLYMNNRNDGNVAVEGGVHPGVQASQGGCDDGVTWKTNFSWQVYSK